MAPLRTAEAVRYRYMVVGSGGCSCCAQAGAETLDWMEEGAPKSLSSLRLLRRRLVSSAWIISRSLPVADMMELFS